MQTHITGTVSVPTPLRKSRRWTLLVVEMDAKEQVGLGLRTDDDCQANPNTNTLMQNWKIKLAKRIKTTRMHADFNQMKQPKGGG